MVVTDCRIRFYDNIHIHANKAGKLRLGVPTPEEDECVAGGAAIRLLDEENPVFIVQHAAGLLSTAEELDLANTR
jgi:hypothetical protein